MSNKNEELATWLYRGLLSIMAACTLAVVSATYSQFQDMRTDVAQQKIINQQVESRLSKLEK